MKGSYRGHGLMVIGTAMGLLIGFLYSWRAVNVTEQELALLTAIGCVGGPIIGAFCGYVLSLFFEDDREQR